MKAGRRIYSAAYIMPPGFGRSAKHQNWLKDIAPLRSGLAPQATVAPTPKP